MGRLSREKGKRGERELAKALRAELGVPARRGQQFAGGPDSPDVVGWEGVHLEVKRTERLQLRQAIAQASSEAAPGHVPVVAHRWSNGPWLLVVPLDCLVDLAGRVADALERSLGDDRDETGGR